MNIFLLLVFLLFNIYFENIVFANDEPKDKSVEETKDESKDEEPTIEQCNSVMTSNDKYNITDCECIKDFAMCLFSSILVGTCKNTTFPPDGFFKQSCKDIYSQCDNTEKECYISNCDCFKSSMISCILQKKCKPLPNDSTSTKHVRSIRSVDLFDLL